MYIYIYKHDSICLYFFSLLSHSDLLFSQIETTRRKDIRKERERKIKICENSRETTKGEEETTAMEGDVYLDACGD